MAGDVIWPAPFDFYCAVRVGEIDVIGDVVGLPLEFQEVAFGHREKDMRNPAAWLGWYQPSPEPVRGK